MQPPSPGLRLCCLWRSVRRNIDRRRPRASWRSDPIVLVCSSRSTGFSFKFRCILKPLLHSQMVHYRAGEPVVLRRPFREWLRMAFRRYTIVSNTSGAAAAIIKRICMIWAVSPWIASGRSLANCRSMTAVERIRMRASPAPSSQRVPMVA